MSKIPCTSFDVFFALFERKVLRGYTIFLIFFIFFIPYSCIFYNDLVGLCHVINIKGVIWVFPYLRNAKAMPTLNNNF